MRSVQLAIASVASVAAVAILSTRSLTATVDDGHAGHVVAPGARSHHVQQATGIPPSGTTAAERLAASPRKGEWVTIKVGAGDSLIAWVVRPQRTTPAPVVIVIH